MAEEAQVESFDSVDEARGASSVIEATEEVVDPPLGMPKGPSATELLPEEGVEATTPPLRMMLGLSLRTGLRGLALLNILRLRTMRGLSVVSIHQGLLINPRNCLRCESLQVLSSNCFSKGEVLRWL